MSDGGKLIGGIIGAVIGGPIGLGIGVFIGSLIDADDEKEKSDHSTDTPQTESERMESAIFLFRKDRQVAVQCPCCEGIAVLQNPGTNWMCKRCETNFIFQVTEDNLNDQNGEDYINIEAALSCQFLILGALSKCDGTICEKEINAVERMLVNIGGNKEQLDLFKNFFLKGINCTEEEVFSCAKLLGNILFCNEKDRLTIIYDLVSLAYEDGHFDSEEEDLIKYIAVEYMGVELSRIDAVIATIAQMVFNEKNGHSSEFISALRVLECTVDDSFDDIKSAYKLLCKKFHPDTVSGKQLPEEFIKFATERFQEVQNAYYIVSEHFKTRQSAA